MMQVSAEKLLLHPRFSGALERARQVILRGQKGEALILPLFGPSRVGKTELIKMLMQDHPRSTLEGRCMIPVLRVTTPVNPTRRSLPEALLATLDPRKYGRSSAEQLTARARGLLELADTRVIIFDEIQHFVERSSKSAAREAADWLKVLGEEMRLTILMVGLPIAEEILNRNEQLRYRAEAPFWFYPYNWNEPTERAAFQGTLTALCNVLAQAGWQIPDAHCPDFVRRAYAASLGRIGMLIKLFVSAEAASKAARLDTPLLFRAYAESIGTKLIADNPFDPDAVLDDSVLVQGYVKLLDEAHMPVPSSQRRRASSKSASAVEARL
ncbi:TniB family NTP-binding protein [Pseudomonas sp. OTU5201]|uniref:TniB family NTP-binding protein n=1 Tax=Pseudomonas sp. OTU5201 TaxID=3043850 RepID=UPI00313E7395